LVIPKKLKYVRDGQIINNIVSGEDPIFTRGKPIRLLAGYDGRTEEIFKGYISDISPQLPLEFRFEDDMYILKQTTITNYSKKDLTLKSLLTDILPAQYQNFKALDVQLGWMRIKRSNVASILDHLKSHYGLTCTFRGGVLYAGLRYDTTDPLNLNIHEFVFERDIIDDSRLVYKREDDVLIKLKAVSINDKNEKIEVEVGDTFGDQRTMYFYGLDEKALREIAEESIVKMKYEGFFGSFETFLQPKVEPGDAVKMVNKKLPEKDGVYLVKAVDATWGVYGGRQTIHLDRKVV
jgi:hypothetical protein